MTTFYTTEQIDEQAGVIGRYLKTVSTNLTEYIDLIQDRFGGEVEVTSTAKAYFKGM